jgi:iron complex transport system substrate-binding protein
MSFLVRSCILLAAVFAAGCGEAPASSGSIAVVDDAGHTVRLEAPARRILSLIPARTDALLALRAGDRLIARTTWDTATSLAHLPSLGDALTPSVEWIAARSPDLVVAWPDAGSRTAVARLRALGLPVYASRVETLADVRRALTDLGTLTGLEERAAAELHAMDATLDSVRTSVAGRERPRVLYLVGVDPPVAAGPGTLVHELIDAAGGTNVMADATSPWPSVSLEALFGRDPDVVIVAVGGTSAPALAEQPGWRGLDAVRAGRVHVIDPYEFNRPGPSAGHLAHELAALLHPGEAR